MSAPTPTPSNGAAAAYWKGTLRLLLISLSIWALFGFVLSIFLVEPLNSIQIFGFKLGFWFAQQGAIFAFVILIFAYARRMNTLERKHDVHED
ncbi:MAG: DUF4212 domain-containing protein [Pseudomonadota bacterium]